MTHLARSGLSGLIDRYFESRLELPPSSVLHEASAPRIRTEYKGGGEYVRTGGKYGIQGGGECTRFSFASASSVPRALSARLRLTMIALLAAPSTLGAPAHRSPRSLARSPARLFVALPHLSCLFSGLVISTPLPLSRRCELRLPAMCDAGEDAPAAEEEPPAASVLDDLSGVPAEVLDPRSGTRALVLHLALERTRIQL